jgi:NADH-quinone oxidoreductase subunit L
MTDGTQATSIAAAPPLHIPAATAEPGYGWLALMLIAPVASAILCGAFAMLKVRGRWPAVFTVLAFAATAVAALVFYAQWSPGFFAGRAPLAVPLFDWITFQWGEGPWRSFTANIGFYIDGLTLLWMLFVTVLATLIALFASEYMEQDAKAGYARFFFGVSLFVASMLMLVMSDNLIGLYLGWEGVGFCSYFLIGYYYQQPGATAAAKKAFIMNRIGDFGLAFAIFLIWMNYGTVGYDGLFQALTTTTPLAHGSWDKAAIPFLLLLAVAGKSAQLPLATWLPDAMWGPTPVSALIHAATMVTAGIFLLARMAPFFTAQAIGTEWAEMALLAVGWVGCATALWSATIACGTFDYKRVFAYSTVSSLGYMVMGMGVGAAFGSVYYLFAHAWFKALLFLTAGAAMHGLAGQLDLRKVSGLMKVPGFRITMVAMLVGCLYLAAAPFTAGALSKDVILYGALTSAHPQLQMMGWIGLLTAAITAYYAFRVWFRVAIGPTAIEPGPDQHGHGGDEHDAHPEDARAHAAPAGHDHHGGAHAGAHGWHPHPPGFRINLVLVVTAIGAVAAGLPSYLHSWHVLDYNWVDRFVEASSAGFRAGEGAEHGHILGGDAHTVLFWLATACAVVGIGAAWVLHGAHRGIADGLRRRMLASRALRWIPNGAENGWWLNEIYQGILGIPAWWGSQVLAFTDKFVLDGVVVALVGRLPAALGKVFQPLYSGVLQGYALTMVGGVGLIIAWVVWIWLRGGAP